MFAGSEKFKQKSLQKYLSSKLTLRVKSSNIFQGIPFQCSLSFKLKFNKYIWKIVRLFDCDLWIKILQIHFKSCLKMFVFVKNERCFLKFCLKNMNLNAQKNNLQWSRRSPSPLSKRKAKNTCHVGFKGFKKINKTKENIKNSK